MPDATAEPLPGGAVVSARRLPGPTRVILALALLAAAGCGVAALLGPLYRVTVRAGTSMPVAAGAGLIRTCVDDTCTASAEPVHSCSSDSSGIQGRGWFIISASVLASFLCAAGSAVYAPASCCCRGSLETGCRVLSGIAFVVQSFALAMFYVGLAIPFCGYSFHDVCGSVVRVVQHASLRPSASRADFTCAGEPTGFTVAALLAAILPLCVLCADVMVTECLAVARASGASSVGRDNERGNPLSPNGPPSSFNTVGYLTAFATMPSSAGGFTTLSNIVDPAEHPIAPHGGVPNGAPST